LALYLGLAAMLHSFPSPQPFPDPIRTGAYIYVLCEVRHRVPA